jgi:acetate kinase
MVRAKADTMCVGYIRVPFRQLIILDFGPKGQSHVSPGQRPVGTMRRFHEGNDPEAVQAVTPGVRSVVRCNRVHYTAWREASFDLRPTETALIDPSSVTGENDMTAPAINRPARSCILTVNGGSSSLKFAVFDYQQAHTGSPERLIAGKIERIGLPDARVTISGPGGKVTETSNVDVSDLGASADLLITWLDKHVGCEALAGVGHRVVHGGPRYHRPEPITAEVIAELRRLGPLDVDHLPGEVALIERFQRLRPGLFQIACFDTGFHHDMPRVAQIVPIPRRYQAAGVRRYGFHGLSYAYLVEELARVAGPEAARGRVILAHLGSGASLAAVRHGKSVDTTMGLTPASGIVMATRTGDLDPGLPFFLAECSGMTTERFHAVVNHESGLLGVSEISPDLRDLLARQKHDDRAAEAVALFFYQARKAIGALAAALGGLDILVFSGGIGENSAEARARICEGLEFLGISLHQGRNQANEPVISAGDARTDVRIIRTDEESMIALDVAGLLAARSAGLTST